MTLIPGSIGTAATLVMIMITLAHMASAQSAKPRRKRMLFPFGLGVKKIRCGAGAGSRVKVSNTFAFRLPRMLVPPDVSPSLGVPLSKPHNSSTVIMYGRHTASWVTALDSTAAVWPRIGVSDVLTMPGDNPDELSEAVARIDNPTVIPLMEPHIKNCPRSYRSLFPTPAAVKTLEDKQAFAHFIAEEGLEEYCPATYTADDVQFPCVIKRLNLNAGQGVEIATSNEHLQLLIQQKTWAGHPYILQQYIPSECDFVTNAVCKNARIIWHCTYKLTIEPPGGIQRPGTTISRERVETKKDVLVGLTKFLKPLRYDGPVNFDYKFDTHGKLNVLEINPRLGGSLVAPANIDDLAAALSTILENTNRTLHRK